MTGRQRRQLATQCLQAAEELARKFHVKVTVTAGPVKVVIPPDVDDDEPPPGERPH